MKFLKIIINTLISLFLFILIIVLMFITSCKTLISKENISTFISDANILNVDVNILFNQEESGVTLKEKIYQLALENSIPEEIIEDILKSEQINQLLGDFFNKTITYIIEGGEKPQISQDTIIDIKKVAKLSLNDHINIMIEEEQLSIYIDNYCNDIVKIVPDRNDIVGEIPTESLEKIINFNVMYIYIIVLLLLILISIINKKWFYFINTLGITMLLSGIIFVIFGSMEYIITNLVVEKLSGMIPFIIPLITNILTIGFKTGVFVSFSSIVLILIYVTIKRMSNSK